MRVLSLSIKRAVMQINRLIKSGCPMKGRDFVISTTGTLRLLLKTAISLKRLKLGSSNFQAFFMTIVS